MKGWRMIYITRMRRIPNHINLAIGNMPQAV